MSVTQTEFETAIDKISDPITAYAYASTPTATTCTAADTWYFFASTFTNQVASNISGHDNGIRIDKDGRIEIEFVADGSADKSGRVSLGIVKNGTFTAGELTSGSVLAGSEGSYYADISGAGVGDGSALSLWAGDIEDGDIISLVIKCQNVTTTFTPVSAATSLQQLT